MVWIVGVFAVLASMYVVTLTRSLLAMGFNADVPAWVGSNEGILDAEFLQSLVVHTLETAEAGNELDDEEFEDLVANLVVLAEDYAIGQVRRSKTSRR